VDRFEHSIDRLHAAGSIRREHLLLLLLSAAASAGSTIKLLQFIDSLLKLFDSIFQLLNIGGLLRVCGSAGLGGSTVCAWITLVLCPRQTMTANKVAAAHP
jgi:hypothetical protein